MQSGGKRLYLLRDRAWPRSTEISVAGTQIEHTATADGAVTLSPLIPFDADHEIRVAKGTSVLLRVRADATKVVPEYCTAYYQTEEHDRGSVNLQKLGRIRDNYQAFASDSKPFRGILSSITFDVRGHDHRVRGYRLRVVPSPSIVETKLDCVFPPYMVDEDLSVWLPRTIDLASGTQLPHGTQITIRARANKDLTRVDIRDVQTQETTVYDVAQAGRDLRQIEYSIPRLTGNVALELTLHDTDGVASDPPIRLSIGGIEDRAPAVAATLRGIGTAITPDAIIPAQGKITDDYDVDRSWFDVAINDSEPRQFPFDVPDTGQLDATLDFRALRAAEGGLALQPRDKLAVTLMASDRCNLSASPNVGSGDRYQLDVVRARSCWLLEPASWVSAAGWSRSSTAGGNAGFAQPRRGGGRPAKHSAQDRLQAAQAAPDGKGRPAHQPSQAKIANSRCGPLGLQRATVQAEKLAQEFWESLPFYDIRENDQTTASPRRDRKVRLQEQVADPLRRIG